MTRKPYKCTGCGHEVEEMTNHWGEIYPWCYVCQEPTVWECQEECPEGYEKPQQWKRVKLGEVANIMEVSKRTKIK
jgi:predicted amidophosphoribosyltransferase